MNAINVKRKNDENEVIDACGKAENGKAANIGDITKQILKYK